jgi:hypothetical protein
MEISAGSALSSSSVAVVDASVVEVVAKKTPGRRFPHLYHIGTSYRTVAKNQKAVKARRTAEELELENSAENAGAALPASKSFDEQSLQLQYTLQCYL